MTAPVVYPCDCLTVVHTNRVLRELRLQGWVEFTRGFVVIRNIGSLKAFAEFDPTYLYMEDLPR